MRRMIGLACSGMLALSFDIAWLAVRFLDVGVAAGVLCCSVGVASEDAGFRDDLAPLSLSSAL